jgi:hypothetical protein
VDGRLSQRGSFLEEDSHASSPCASRVSDSTSLRHVHQGPRRVRGLSQDSSVLEGDSHASSPCASRASDSTSLRHVHQGPRHVQQGVRTPLRVHGCETTREEKVEEEYGEVPLEGEAAPPATPRTYAWEFLDDVNTWVPFGTDDQYALEDALVWTPKPLNETASCDHRNVRLGPLHWLYTVDRSDLELRHVDTGKRRQIRRRPPLPPVNRSPRPPTNQSVVSRAM